jgi:hypothetical protein
VVTEKDLKDIERHALDPRGGEGEHCERSAAAVLVNRLLPKFEVFMQ